MGELLYLYLEENNLLEELANSLVVERNVAFINKKKCDTKEYFEGIRYFDNKDFREYLDCYKYSYTVNTRFTINGECVFSYLDTRRGVSVEEEKPKGVYYSEHATMDYYNAQGREVVLYQKSNSNESKEYKSTHICYNGESKSKAFRLPRTLKCLLSNERDFALVVCRMYNINLDDYNSELLRRKKIFEKISVIDKQIIALEKLKNSYLNELSYGEKKKTK